ncbi:MAG: hypothetical protein SO053_02260 [Bifidobacterium animalis]|uniref:hypothetical protein n=1 Tax=Bifidobacterium animalis TaxID=28025 RepID=UPI0010205F38|nr:hypothetical protein [Bifidobacterium animalis]MCI6532733.1 hypothetical protein [Bifidobacterium animalis]MDY5039964.1 hypothetical protein [Bifidobacterium animalis]RYN12608.1 hypothetical protein PG2006B_1275 [Bifidobacterium animalis subsp. animalis]RYN13367.1 hypothetical protein PG2022B_1465 [Bifidobacterium animalis subsp. animalis]
MAVPMRSTRSNVSPAGRQSDPALKRPHLHVVESGEHHAKETGHGAHVASSVIAWTRSRPRPWLHTAIAILFLVLCWIGTLMLRTQMVENSFESSQVEQNITMLRQDVEDDQAKLSNLEATLPDRAQKLNMVPASGSLTIDLNGYQPPKDEKATTGESAEQQATSNQHDSSQGGATE